MSASAHDATGMASSCCGPRAELRAARRRASGSSLRVAGVDGRRGARRSGGAPALVAVWRWHRTTVVVTTEKLFVVQGTLHRRAAAVASLATGPVELEQSLLGRLLGYGTLSRWATRDRFIPGAAGDAQPGRAAQRLVERSVRRRRVRVTSRAAMRRQRRTPTVQVSAREARDLTRVPVCGACTKLAVTDVEADVTRVPRRTRVARAEAPAREIAPAVPEIARPCSAAGRLRNGGHERDQPRAVEAAPAATCRRSGTAPRRTPRARALRRRRPARARASVGAAEVAVRGRSQRERATGRGRESVEAAVRGGIGVRGGLIRPPRVVGRLLSEAPDARPIASLSRGKFAGDHKQRSTSVAR